MSEAAPGHEATQDDEAAQGDSLTVSVRCEASRTVAPDLVVLSGTITSVGAQKADALAAAAEALTGLTTDLTALGGQALTPDNERLALTWSAHSTRTDPERVDDDTTGKWQRPTGRIVAAVSVGIRVRDFAVLDAIERTLAAHAAFNVHNTGWRVDEDNVAWPLVRADAIHAAVAMARDYAAALGGTLRSVDHIADSGLLGGEGGLQSQSRGRGAPGRPAGGSTEDWMATPGLDPVPQLLSATIDARFTATGITLS